MKMLFAFLCLLITMSSASTGVCRCIGVGELTNLVTPDDTDKTLLVNEGYGEYCRAWDHPAVKTTTATTQVQLSPYRTCQAASLTDLQNKCGDNNWCVTPWCYVTDQTCTDSSVLRTRSDTFKGVNNLYYTYDLCGYVDCFGSPDTFGCPNDPVRNPIGHAPPAAADATTDQQVGTWTTKDNLSCDAETCVCIGTVTSQDGNSKIPVAYNAVMTEHGAPECIACPEADYKLQRWDIEYQGTNAASTSTAFPFCNRCVKKDEPNKGSFYSATMCGLPTDAPTGYEYAAGKRIAGVCTDISCHAPTLVDVNCASGYMAGSTTDTTERFNPYVPRVGPFVTNEGCDSNGNAKLRGCVPNKPVTEVFEFKAENTRRADGEADYSGTQTYDYNLCTSSADCRPGHGFCDTISDSLSDMQLPGVSGQKPTKRCMECPASEAHCDNHNLIYEAATCKSVCFSGSVTYPRKTCKATSTGSAPGDQTFDTEGQCDPGEFCMLDAGFTHDGSTVNGVCQLCEIVDPNRSGQCKDSKDFQNEYVGAECEKKCRTSVSQPTPPVGNANYLRYSDLENVGNSFGLTTPYGGWCSAVLTTFRELCNSEDGTASVGSLSTFSYTNYETKDSNSCSVRFCGNQDGSIDKEKGNYCIVQTQNTGQLCTLEMDAGQGAIVLTGTCQNGYCVLGGQQCPAGFTEKKDADGNFLYYNPQQIGDEPCEENGRNNNVLGVFDSNKCVDTDNKCDRVPRANQAICTSVSHKDDASIGHTVNPLFPTVDFGNVDTFFHFMYFLQVQTYGLTTEMVEVQLKDPDGVKITGRALVCDPYMSETLKEQYKCLISAPGEYVYAGSTIRLIETSNTTTHNFQMQAVPQLAPFYMVFVCPGSNTNRCFGSIDCDWFEIPDNQLECAGSFVQCERVTTMSPTKPPTGTPTSTAHGDPIIWTFNDECYDLNKDGLYDATVNERFNHDVQIGVYNDFMREVRVIDDNGDVIISINSLGEYEKKEDWNYGFSYEEKECPEEMKETECYGTYKEWIFDAQEFQYTVHLLRHDYKDAGIPEGDLGYHLDIYPRPYKSFHNEGHKEQYSGLFFENPLPEELEFCPGGSARRES